MSPKVLARVLYNNFEFPTESPILLRPAVLENYVRSGLIDESYSALTGIVVRNVSQKQVDRLDEFEGDEYERRTVVVHDLETGEALEAQCYIWVEWVDDVKRFTGADWDFEESC
ncbi:hypothetical protein V1507DRAFT_447353, partial [Lipomyces tetrasporus]